jgi:hypothetical protein
VKTGKTIAGHMLVIVFCAGVFVAGCDDPPHAVDIPENLDTILSFSLLDDIDDQVRAPADAPPYRVSYPPADVLILSLGVDGTYLYLWVAFAGIIPGSDDPILATGDAEAQTVTGQGVTVGIDLDNNRATGFTGYQGSGLDIAFTVSSVGGHSSASAFVDENANGLGILVAPVDGTVLTGGANWTSVLVRYDISSLFDYLQPGRSVQVEAWAEAASDLYHHLAFDVVPADTWVIP